MRSEERRDTVVMAEDDCHHFWRGQRTGLTSILIKRIEGTLMGKWGRAPFPISLALVTRRYQYLVEPWALCYLGGLTLPKRQCGSGSALLMFLPMILC